VVSGRLSGGRDKRGVSAKFLQRELAVAYQTAWTMAHKLRHGLSEDPARPLRGFLEADETFIGGRGDATSRGRSTASPDTHARRERLQDEVRFARDSPLEGDGFEPSVPRGGQHFSRPPRNPATTRRPLSRNWILTMDKGRFTVRRARLAPAMISTLGQRASRRRQRGALPAWSLFRLWPAGTRRWRPAGRGNDTAIPGHRNNPTRHLKRATHTRSGGMCADSGGSRPRIRDDVAQHPIPDYAHRSNP
jgi:hypothetical protein